MTTEKPRVAILTSLVDFSPAYSLVGIILDQARLLKQHGYQYDLLCLKGFNKSYADAIAKEGLSIKYILPQTRLHDYQPNEPPKKAWRDKESGKMIPGFDEQVDIHFIGDPDKGWVGYKDVLKSYDVVIDHDLMFLSWHLPQNAALRRCIEMWPNKNWLHWVHSGPSSPPPDVCHPSTLRFSAAPHSHYVYLNESQRLEYSLMIQAPKTQVSTVYNPKDVRDVYEFDSETCSFIDRYDLLDHQILAIYPFSSPRWKDKGVRQLIKIFSFWKKQKVKAKLVLVNAHCNQSIDDPLVERMEAYAKVCELTLDEDVILTSRFADEQKIPDWKYTVPFNVVRNLVQVSNIFIFPSVSECCSLIQAEASIAGKFVVLNRDFMPMLEFSHPSVMHYEFTRNDPDGNAPYYECVAREIWANLQHDAAIMNSTMAKTRWYNKDWIFRNQFEPLLYRNFSGDPRARQTVEQDKNEYGSDLRPEFRPEIEIENEDGEIIRTPLERIVVAKRKMSDEEIAKAKEHVLERKKTESVEDVECKAISEPKISVERKGNIDEPQDFNDPVVGRGCPIFGVCTEENKNGCFGEAGHCAMLDELVEEV